MSKISIEIDAEYQEKLDFIKEMFPDAEGKRVDDNGESVDVAVLIIFPATSLLIPNSSIFDSMSFSNLNSFNLISYSIYYSIGNQVVILG